MSSYGWGIDALWKNKHVIARPQAVAIPWMEDRTGDTVRKIRGIATSPGGSSQ